MLAQGDPPEFNPVLTELHRRLSELVTSYGMNGADTVDTVCAFFEEIGRPLPNTEVVNDR